MNFKVLGTTQDITSCDCCGRINLNKTVALEIEGVLKFMGTTCAANAVEANKVDVARLANHADTERKQEFANFMSKVMENHDAMIARAPALSDVGFAARMKWIREQPENQAVKNRKTSWLTLMMATVGSWAVQQ
jgi:hypothetical protein